MASPVDIDIILNELGCTEDGSFLPVANDENKRLIAEIAELEQRKENRAVELIDVDQRLQNLKVHLEHADQEIGQNLKLLNVQRHQSDSEKHALSLALNERAAHEKSVATDAKELEATEQLNFEAMTRIEALNVRVEKYSKKIEWAKTAFDEFQAAIARGDDANEIMQKFAKADRKRAEDLECKRQLLQASIVKRQAVLVANTEQTRSLENVLNRTAQLYRKAHEERQRLIGVWRDSIAQMVEREREIWDAERGLREAKMVSVKREQKLAKMIAKSEQQAVNGKELELQVEEMNEKISSERNKLNQQMDAISLKTNELELLRKNVMRVSKELIGQRKRNRQLAAEKEAGDKSLDGWKTVLETLQKRYATFKGKSYSIQDRLRELDQLIEIEERNVKILTAENLRLSGAMYKAQQHLTEMGNEEKTLDSDVTSIENCLKRMKGVYQKNDQELQRQTLNLYTIDLNISQTEQRIDRMQGKTFDVDDECLTRLMELERVFEAKSKTFQALRSDIGGVEGDLKRLNGYFNQDQQDLDKLRGALKEKVLLCESGEKRIQAETLANQEKLVEENFLKLKVRHLEKMLRSQSEKIVNMQRFREDVEKTVGQRMRELKTQGQALAEKKKHLNDFRQKLKQELAEQSVKLEVLKKRHNLITDLLTRNDEGEVVTGAQLKIRMAQEKQILLDTGNKLNAKVLQAEQDIKAMENTLRVVNYSNDTYRRNTLHSGQDGAGALKQLHAVQEKYNQAVTRLKRLQSTLLLKAEQLGEINGRLEDQTEAFNCAVKETLDHSDVLMKVHKDLLDQKLKLQRAEREMKVARKRVRQKVGDREAMELIERDLAAREMQEQNESALQQLADLVDANPGMMACVAKHLHERGLSMPMGSRVKKSSQKWSWGSGKSVERDGTPKSSGREDESSAVTSQQQQPSVVLIDFPASGSSSREQIYRKAGGVKANGN